MPETAPVRAASSPRVPGEGRSFRFLLIETLLIAALAAAGAGAAWLAARSAREVFLELGPNSAGYLRGFRAGGWEREGTTRYHWTTTSSWIQLPVRAVGPGFTLRARVRRHMVEPARIGVSVEGRTVETFSIAADTKIAYKEFEIRLPSLQGHHPFVAVVDASSNDTRGLGMAIDWTRLEARGSGRFRPLPGLSIGLAALIALCYAVPRLTGAGRLLALGHSSLALIAALVGGIADFLAFDRIVRDAVWPYLLVAVVCLAATSLFARVGVSKETRGLLTVLVLVALIVRLGLLLHPRFFYPDMAIHGTVAYVLSKEGLATFIERFAQTQFRFSLGLQFQAGHTYAFPYAPGLYVLAWPLIALARIRPEIAVASIAALLNSLGLLVTFALARRLLGSERGALLAAVAHLALPLYFVRLTMAYFPSVTGHAFDAAALTFLLFALDRRCITLGRWAALAALLTASLLLYSQALVNFAILFGLYLAWDFVAERSSDARRRQIVMGIVVAFALLLSLVVFYKRYIPVFLDMRHGTPMVEEQILLEKQRVEREYAASRGETPVHHEEIDPYSGPDFNPLRGLWRVAARLFIFYGPFLFSVTWGLYALIRPVEGTTRRYLAVWAALFFVVCFLAGALPSPNFLRYSKDLEASAPLFCVAFALATSALARRSLALAAVHVAGFIALGAWHGLRQWFSMLETASR